jgi:hypothetical protein
MSRTWSSAAIAARRPALSAFARGMDSTIRLLLQRRLVIGEPATLLHHQRVVLAVDVREHRLGSIVPSALVRTRTSSA